MIHVFADCELDETRFELRRRGAVVKLEPKTFDLLAYLLKSGDRVVSKDELLDAVWPGQAVSESVLPKCIAAARRAVGDPRAQPAVIQTVHGRGYRMMVAVRQRPASMGEDSVAAGNTFAPPFVGHAPAMERLRAALEGALAGRGRTVLLAGEPGIGKTRTAEELAAEARRRHAMVLIGRATEGDGAPAFWPWVQILRASLARSGARHAGTPAATEIAAVLGELQGSGERAGHPSAREAEQARFRLFDRLTAAMGQLAERQGLVVVLDDLHWADEATLGLVAFLARDLSERRLLLLATYRDVDVHRGHPLGTLLGRLAREPSCERVALRGFASDDTARLIAGVAGAPPSAAVAAAVHDMTEGNPFFIQEVVRLLASDTLTSEDTSALPLLLPQSVRDAIGRRLDGLSQPCNTLLRVAAVLGRDFSTGVLARVTEQTQADVLEQLSEAVRARVLDEARGRDGDAPGSYRFHHSLIRQALYDEMPTPERVRWHARVGTALEAACGADLEPHLDELAHHFFQAAAADTSARTVDYCVRAAERAGMLLAYEQSVRQYERALQALEVQAPRDDVRRAELLLAFGDACTLAGVRERALPAFRRAAEIGRELQRADLLGRAAIGYRAAEMGSPADDETRALIEEARTATIGRADLHARVLSRLAGLPPHSDSMARREALSRDALALARRSGHGAALRDALEARLWACLGPDHLDDRLAVAREMLAFAEREPSRHLALLAHDAELGVHLIRGDLGAAERSLVAYTRVAEALREPAFLFHATFRQGSMALARGELTRAEELFRSAQARGRGAVSFAHFMCTAQLYVLQYMRGAADDPELNRVFFGEMMALPYSWEPAMRSALAFALYVRGDEDAARREFAALVARGLDTIRRDEHWLVTMGSMSSVAVMLGDEAAAAKIYDLLLPYAELVFVHDLLRSVGGTVASALGNLAAMLDRFEDGERHFARAHALETAMGGITAFMDRPGYARLLLRRDAPGDRARAEAILTEVCQAMAACGVVRNWQLLELDRRFPPLISPTGRRIPMKPSKNRQDSRGR
jgi:DNA-binding winged helix-turn-helix (wHTH) protein